MSTTTKERPILFSAPMVRAILEGRKKQTRRIMKPQYEGHRLIGPDWYEPAIEGKDGELRDGKPIFGVYDEDGEFGVRSSFEPKMLLWVRETWAPMCSFDPSPETGAVYKADDHPSQKTIPVKWTPSIHMPRWASRIMLEVTGVRVERLTDISPEDAIAEGIDHLEGNNPRDEFRWLWHSIYGFESWSLNPWVWVVDFKKVQA